MPALEVALVAAREAGAQWVINTGRSLEHLLEGMEEFQAPFLPDYLSVNERHLYARKGSRWVEMNPWNEVCNQRHDEMFENVAPLLRRLEDWAAEVGGVTLLPEPLLAEGLVTDDEIVMEQVATFLDELIVDYPEFSYQRNSIYLRFCHRDYHKGAVLTQLAKELGLDVRDILAAGDHFNDISMLDGTHAEMVVCPANAVPLVRKVVQAGGGYLAKKAAGHGTAEGIQHFLQRVSAGKGFSV